jgi:MFS family permease
VTGVNPPAAAQATAPRLWQRPDFLKLWAGQAVSIMGSGITSSALPLIAVLLLGATAGEMGWLLALESAPVLVVGMFAGAWVDRVRRRPLLIAADLGRAGLLICIPALAFAGSLRIEQLFVVAAATGVLTVLFDVTYRSYLPDLVGRDSILEANSRMATVEAVAEVTTPGLAGGLIQVIAAPLVVLLDAASFVVSAACVITIRHHEKMPAASGGSANIFAEIAHGPRAVMGSPVLRALAGCEALRSFIGMFIGALYVLFGLRELGLSPLLIGITVGVGGVSNLLGSLLVERLTRRFGIGRTLVGACMVGCLTPFLIALAPGRPLEGFAVLVLAQSLDLTYPLYAVNSLTLRQIVAPEHLLGRVNATLHVGGRGAIPFGAIVGGALGDAIGLRLTLFVAAAGLVVATAWLVRSSVPSVRFEEPRSEPAQRTLLP